PYAAISSELESALTFYSARVPPAFVATSSDGGAHWTVPGSPGVGSLPGCYTTSLTVAPSNARTVYLVCSRDGSTADLYVSRNAGRTWSSVQSPAPFIAEGNVGFKQLAVDPFDAKRLWAIGRK